MSLPYFNLYPDDFEADTAHLTLLEDGIYNRLLRLCWRTPGCSVPDDEAWIFRKLRARTDEEKEAVRIILDEFFTRKGGKIFNSRLIKEWSTANDKHEKRKKAGSKGGIAKSLKINDLDISNAKALLKQPEPEPEPDIEPKGSLSPEDDEVGFKPVDEIAEAATLYNLAAKESGWPQIKNLSKSRRAALKARLRECGGIEGWRKALSRAQASSHCCGQNDRGWTANFDFLTRQSSFAKLIEGNFDDRKPVMPGAGSTGGRITPSDNWQTGATVHSAPSTQPPPAKPRTITGGRK
ncbi:YdaU family protein [Pseudooceanicola atlanticus]|uniref:YdaU family protein n=1 Tax=Pseudooceanicola atlanticus TaxID=1461694 RepID=UPI002356D03C|nr:YdaU family protein [Pseudooceanicola atlanticus]